MWNICSIYHVLPSERTTAQDEKKGVISQYKNLSHLIIHNSRTFLREPYFPGAIRRLQVQLPTVRDQTTGKQLTAQLSRAAMSMYRNVSGGEFGFGHCLFKALQLEAKEEVRTKYQLWKEIRHSSHDTSPEPADTYGTACPAPGCRLSYSGLLASTRYR